MGRETLMAKKEKIYDNSRLYEKLDKQSFTTLSKEAKAVLRETIQSCAFLGKHKVPEGDVYYLVRGCFEVSMVMVEHHLSVYRVSKNQKIIHDVSTIEKYKRVTTMVCEAFTELLDKGISLNDMDRLKPAKTLTDEQEAVYAQMAVDKMTVQERIAYLQTLL